MSRKCFHVALLHVLLKSPPGLCCSVFAAAFWEGHIAAYIQQNQKQMCRRIKDIFQAHRGSLKVCALSSPGPGVKLLYGSGRKRTNGQSGRVHFLLGQGGEGVGVERKKAGKGSQKSKGWKAGQSVHVVFVPMRQQSLPLCLYCRCSTRFCPGSCWPLVASAPYR